MHCRAEKVIDSEQLCNHSKDVAFRCEYPGWTGLRLGVLADTCNLQYVTIEKAGLFDYITNEFGPGTFSKNLFFLVFKLLINYLYASSNNTFFFCTALQVDLNRHTFEGVRITSNAGNGLEILYSDLYNSLSYIRNSEFSGNKGAGISFKQLGLTVQGEYLK